MPNLIQQIGNWFNASASTNPPIYIPPAQVMDWQGYDGVAIVNRVYLRIWLAEIFVTQAVSLGRNIFPCATAQVTVKGPTGSDLSSTPYILGLPPDKMKAKGVFASFAITDMMPFVGGTVQIEAYLSIVVGNDLFGETIDILQGFNSLALGSGGPALSVARALRQGIDKLYGNVDGTVRLGYNYTFSGQELNSGYVAIIDDPKHIYSDLTRFRVRANSLRYCQGATSEPKDEGQPIQDVDHMMLRIELQREHENWRLIEGIKKTLEDACILYMQGKNADGDIQKSALRTAIYQSPSLVFDDKKRVKAEAEADLINCAGGAAPAALTQSTPPPPQSIGVGSNISLKDFVES